MDATVIQAAAPIGAAGAALLLVGRARMAIAAGFILLAAAEGALAYALAPSREVHLAFAGPLRVAALICGALVLAGAAAALLRFPAFAPVALVAVAPFRVPIHLAGTEAFLLVPLYVVLAAACLAFVVRLAREPDVLAPPAWLGVPAAVFIAVTALSALWSLDVEASGVDLLFFYFPFAALVAVVARTPLGAATGRALAVAAIAVAVGLGAIGLWQLESNDLFFARDLQKANAYTTYDRTTSLFHDPSIYGRYLVVAILLLVVVLWFERIGLMLGIGLVAFLAVALFFTYSQSSMVTLAAGLVFVTLIAADRRSKTIVLASALVLLLVGMGVVAATARTESLRRATSGRSDLITNASEVAARHPFVGVGINAEERATRELIAAEPGRLRKVSHTAPLTVAAELGAVGLAAYLAFLTGAAFTFLGALRRNRTLGTALTAVFLAVFVHALFYSGFFEDPLVWLSLAVAGSLCVAPRPAEASAPVVGVTARAVDAAPATRRTQV
jgi:O-antigen ligase/polysaccharide polymerase Wzy-like membrane protein